MKKLLLLSVAAILSFTACQTSTTTSVTTPTNDAEFHKNPTKKNAQAKIQSSTISANTYYFNDPAKGYQTVFDMLYSNGNDTIYERYVFWLDTANVTIPALKPSLFPINTNSFVLTVDANGKISPTSYSYLPGNSSASTPTNLASGSRVINTSTVSPTTYSVSVRTHLDFSASANINIGVLGNGTGTVWLETSSDGGTTWVKRGVLTGISGSLIGLNTTNYGNMGVDLQPNWRYKFTTTTTTSGVGNSITYAFVGGSYYTY